VLIAGQVEQIGSESSPTSLAIAILLIGMAFRQI
jgi:hypothetical protein